MTEDREPLLQGDLRAHADNRAVAAEADSATRLQLLPTEGSDMIQRRFVLLTALLLIASFDAPRQLHSAPPKVKEVDVLVEYRNAPNDVDETVIKNAGGKVKHKHRIVSAIAARVPEDSLTALRNHPKVRIIEPDAKVYADDAELDAAWGIVRINAGVTQSNGATGRGVRVAVIDTGIDYTHPDLDVNYKGGWDFVNDDSDPMDDNGHGTHVAGTIAAEDNGVGVVGVAPQVDLYALKVLNSSGSGSFSDIIAAIEWCIDNNIKVTNNSYGATSDPGTIVRQAFDRAAAAGIVMVCSAGNSGVSDGTGDNVGYPGRYDSVISVAATGSTNLRASFSSTGGTVDVAAPGVSINSTILGGGYGLKSGTSMACPHVAGAAAVLVGSGGNLSSVRQALLTTAVDLGVTGVDNWYGTGLIDVAAALSSLGSTPPPPPPPSPTPTVRVSAITYSMSGGKANNKNLVITVKVVDQDGLARPSASVNVKVSRGTAKPQSFTGTTGTAGTVVFTITGAKSGTYSTSVAGVTATGYAWDGVTPANSYLKK